MTQKHIQVGWESYQSMVIPKDASDTQIRETRQAFYAGAALLWQSLMLFLDNDAEPTTDDMQRMEDLQVEIDAYGQQLDRDLLKLPTH
ncbi:hypothetical protein LCGC14_1797330 [marine sediment metagenome]|uniref:Uncharacterized protein n=1 Tax=marine sediment metagenome TaxID=412755 RepID=A0A0F9HDC4_9ZZZZ